MRLRWRHDGSDAELGEREILGQSARAFLAAELAQVAGRESDAGRAAWDVELGAGLLFNREGLQLVARALRAYDGAADLLTFAILPDAESRRDYYSLLAGASGAPGTTPIALPITARRGSLATQLRGAACLTLPLAAWRGPLPFPAGLAEPMVVAVPRALLLPRASAFDFLFANQIALVGRIARETRRSPLAFLRALATRRRALPLTQRVALAFRHVARSADVHPTAVIEGSIIEPGARVGAHCVVRFSYVGRDARLHDGAKVEFSVVGASSWLMHDLVLYRAATEADVFLIHGPYQFSAFERASAAFATILTDYRPDGRPIKVATFGGLRDYEGRFLGSVLKPFAKTLGGSVLAPGRVVPPDTWLTCPPDAVHTLSAGPSSAADAAAARGAMSPAKPVIVRDATFAAPATPTSERPHAVRSADTDSRTTAAARRARATVLAPGALPPPTPLEPSPLAPVEPA